MPNKTITTKTRKIFVFLCLFCYIKVSFSIGYIIIPSKRLLFCSIAKVGSTSFLSLFNRLSNDTIAYGTVQGEKIAEILNFEFQPDLIKNTSWSKVLFFRDPLERFLSAYLSKCTPGHDSINSHCPLLGQSDMSFTKLIRYFKHHNEFKTIKDPHWRPQHTFCGGLFDTLKYFDGVYHFSRPSLHNTVTDMLERFGFFPSVDSNVKRHVQRVFPLNSKLERLKMSKTGHNTYADFQLQNYFTNHSEIDVVLNIYRGDYDIFNLTVPLWTSTLL